MERQSSQGTAPHFVRTIMAGAGAPAVTIALIIAIVTLKNNFDSLLR
jgi:hypothetical protein